MWWWIVLTVAIFPGCVSLAAQNATRAPQGRASTQIAKDEAECETYAKVQAKNRHDHYRVCMIAGHTQPTSTWTRWAGLLEGPLTVSSAA